MWGLLLGVRLARQLGLSWIVFELDSQVVVDTVRSGTTRLSYLNPLLQEILLLLQEPGWRVSVTHVFCEANRCADVLARRGLSASSFDFSVVDTVYPLLGIVLADDARGTALPWLA